MSDSIRILGRATPPAAGSQHTTLYTVGRRGDAGTDSLSGNRPGVQTIISSIVVCESNNVAATITISVVPQGDTRESKNEIFSSYALGQRETKIISAGITLSQGDSVTVYASTAHINFFAFGAETT